jgi:hypothetical protein
VGGAYGTHGRGEKSLKVFGEKKKEERDHSEDRGADGRMGSEWDLGEDVWSGFSWLRIWTGGGLL